MDPRSGPRAASGGPLSSRASRLPVALDDLLVAAAALAVYLRTLAPSVTTGDSGELITAAATLSLAHPTGYPLYLLLGHGAIRALGFLEPAVAMNLFSALAAAAAVPVMRRLVHVTSGNRLAAFAAALLLAFSTSFWSQATAARVYALGALLLALALLELARLGEGRGGSLGRAWLWFGLGMANHTVAIVLAPLLAVASLRYAATWPTRLAAASLCLPGAALYAYIPIVASRDPIQSWGDPTSLGRFAAYLSRESFWSKRHVDELGDLWGVAAHYLGQIPVELGWPGAALVVLGAFATSPARRPAVFLGIYLFAANAVLMALHGSRQDIFYWGRYMITGWLGLVLVAGLGLARLLRELRHPAAKLAAALLVPAVALGTGYARADRSSDTWARDFAARILASLEPGAVLFSAEDNVEFPLSYLYHVQGLRPDVELLLPGINSLREKPISPDRAPTYFSYPNDLGTSELRMVPDGLVFRLVRASSDFEGRPWEESTLAAFEAVEGPGDDRYLDRSLVGNYYFLEAINLEQRDPSAALAAIRRLRRISFDNAVNQVNAGLLLERNLQFEEARDAFETAASIDPGNTLAATRARFWRETLERVAVVPEPGRRAEMLAAALVDAGRSDLAARVQGASR